MPFVLKASVSFSWWGLILWIENSELFWSCFSEIEVLGGSVDCFRSVESFSFLRRQKSRVVFWGRLEAAAIELAQVRLLIRLQGSMLKLCWKQFSSALQPFLPNLFSAVIWLQLSTVSPAFLTGSVSYQGLESLENVSMTGISNWSKINIFLWNLPDSALSLLVSLGNIPLCLQSLAWVLQNWCNALSTCPTSAQYKRVKSLSVVPACPAAKCTWLWIYSLIRFQEISLSL